MGRTLQLSRELYLPRALVFDAWSQVEHVAQWYPPVGCAMESGVVEAEPGGRFEMLWREGGGRSGDVGRFETLVRPEGFVCAVRCSSGSAAGALRLHVVLVDQEDACTLTLDIESSGTDLSDESVEALRAVWEARLDRLESYFSAV